MRWEGKVTLFYGGPNNGKHENGVGFMKKYSLLNLVKKFEPVNDRPCYLTITGTVFDIVMINCYDECLERTFNSVPRHSIKIVQGDKRCNDGHYQWENTYGRSRQRCG